MIRIIVVGARGHTGAELLPLQPQIDAANGDTRTRLPGWAVRPTHWAA